MMPQSRYAGVARVVGYIRRLNMLNFFEGVTKMNRKDWLLLTIAVGADKGLTPVQLQKSLFLLGQEFPRKVGASFYKFVPYNYGPFSTDIYSDAQSLQQGALIEIRREGRRWPEYHVTAGGVQRAKAFEEDVPPPLMAYLGEVVRWTQSQSFAGLVRAIYQAYPKFRQFTVFRG